MAKKPEPPKQTNPDRVSKPAWKLLWRKPGDEFWHGVVIRQSAHMLTPFAKEREELGYETWVSNL